MMAVASTVTAQTTNVWIAAAGAWTNPGNWTVGVPVAGQHVVVTNTGASVLLSESTPPLASFTLSQTLIFTNWDSVLTATNVQILSGATVTLPAAFTNWDTANNIFFSCVDFSLHSGAVINADGGGFSGGTYNIQIAGYGPGGGTSARHGGGHGGAGGTQSTPAAGGVTNGQIEAPINPGSGGAREQLGGSGNPGAGGGAVRIAASGTVVINGTITANGQNAGGYSGNAGGSGGSIFITCQTFASSNGILRANGGNDAGSAGAGGGGRIAVIYDTAAQDAMPPIQLAVLSADTARRDTVRRGMIGSLYASDHRLIPQAPSSNGLNGTIYGISAWLPSTLSVQGGWVQTAVETFAVTGRVTLNGARLDFLQRPSWTTLVSTVGENVILTNSAQLHIYAGVTNESTPPYGALLTVAGALTLASNSVIYPYSVDTNGGSVKIQASSVIVATGASINANGLGYLGRKGTGYGPGGGNYTGGGGYGGNGGKASGGWGLAYGDSNAPAMPGSAGGSESSSGNKGGNGGGLIWIESAGEIRVDGSLTANGGPSGGWGGDGGGSGGGLFLTASTFSGNGTMTANGSNGGGSSGGGGGGGRIALLYESMDGFAGTLSVNGGSGGGGAGQKGTIVRKSVATGHLLTINGDPATYGTPNPQGYGTVVVPENTWITNTVGTPANEGAGQRWSCIGYVVTNAIGTEVASGSGTQAVFQMTEPLSLVWRWTNEFYLTATANVGGSLLMDKTGWYTNGTPVSLTAVPGAAHNFLQWSGSGVPAAQRFETTLNLMMDRARTVQANFATNTTMTRAWTGTGSWLHATNWSPSGVPGVSDDLIISNGTMVIDEMLRANSLLISNATVEFRNWDTRLQTSQDVWVRTGGIIRLPAAGFADGEMSNRIHIVARHVTLDAGASVNGAGCGFRGVTRSLDPAPRSTGYGPGAGTAKRGAGHGGQGGNNGGPAYGDPENPLAPGSSGGVESDSPLLLGQSGSGGGAVLIEANGTVTLNGSINVNGGSFSLWSGNAGGSGGSVNLYGRRIAGSSGAIHAAGGTGGSIAGGGAGGRVAVSFVLDETSGPIEGGINVSGGSGGAGSGGTGTVRWIKRSAPGTIIVIR